jgi:hypothetical protein
LEITICDIQSRGKDGTTPAAFTELGVAMLSSVLNSKRAVHMNILIMRVFVRLREILATPGRAVNTRDANSSLEVSALFPALFRPLFMVLL